ncbi:MAG: 23S rRNA (pseudouridine(1915)-N(3))-methyltransferase RlmH [Pseudomonadota bacterium]
MRLIIAAIGKMRDGPEARLVEDYLERSQKLSRPLGLTGPQLHEIDAPKSLSGKERRANEGAALLKAARSGKGDTVIVALDEHGDALTSNALTTLIEKRRDTGASALAFLIGGADGHDETVMQAASKKIAFGPATWPHLLVRTMLTEQIYRSMTMLAGHPYHRS